MMALFHLQGTFRTDMMVEHCHKQSTTGQFLQMCIEDLVMEFGLYHLLCNNKFETYSKYVSDHSLILHACSYNSTYNIKITIPHQELIPNREKDRSIIDLATELYDKSLILRFIQRVRMSLGLVHLSDICAANGLQSDKRFLSKKSKVVGNKGK